MSHVDLEINDQLDRVRRSTSDEINAEIDSKTERNIAQYSALGEEAIKNRVQALDAEWDIERVLEVNASTLALTGVALGALVNKKWLWLSAGVLGFLLQHGIQGWCPPLPVLRRMGIRTRGEIDREKYALLDQLS
ncbi:MAG: DUF2892 domain-containing protein [Methylobacillus glycogenes]|nr:DUF2892 domain-containing protein [Methylobacillus glycogenes]